MFYLMKNNNKVKPTIKNKNQHKTTGYIFTVES